MGTRRNWMLAIGAAVLSVGFLVPTGVLVPEGNAAPAPRKTARPAAPAGSMTATEFAARFQMKVVDQGNVVTLSGALVTVRLYPGTNRVSVVGDTHMLKDAISRSGDIVRIPSRPGTFLSRQILAKRREIFGRRQAFKVPDVQVPTLPPPGPVLPVVKPRPQPKPYVRPKPRPAVKPARATVRGDRSWEPRATERKWKWIVIHHADAVSGNAAIFDRVHRTENGWDSLGYHFVIGNGSDSGDGETEVGPRWPIQKHGAHARNHELGDNRYNEQGVGICLVGDFDGGAMRPTTKQMDELVRLTKWLMARYDIPSHMVVRHCDCCKTECPGENFPWRAFQTRLK